MDYATYTRCVMSKVLDRWDLLQRVEAKQLNSQHLYEVVRLEYPLAKKGSCRHFFRRFMKQLNAEATTPPASAEPAMVTCLERSWTDQDYIFQKVLVEAQAPVLDANDLRLSGEIASAWAQLKHHIHAATLFVTDATGAAVLWTHTPPGVRVHTAVDRLRYALQVPRVPITTVDVFELMSVSESLDTLQSIPEDLVEQATLLATLLNQLHVFFVLIVDDYAAFPLEGRMVPTEWHYPVVVGLSYYAAHIHRTLPAMVVAQWLFGPVALSAHLTACYCEVCSLRLLAGWEGRCLKKHTRCRCWLCKHAHAVRAVHSDQCICMLCAMYPRLGRWLETRLNPVYWIQACHFLAYIHRAYDVGRYCQLLHSKAGKQFYNLLTVNF